MNDCWLCRVAGISHVTRTNDPFNSCTKKEHGKYYASLVFELTCLRSRLEAILHLFRIIIMFHHWGVRCCDCWTPSPPHQYPQ